MEAFKHLINFINNNEDALNKLKADPFNLRVISCSYNPNWFIFYYDLYNSDFSLPEVIESRGVALEIINNKVNRVIKAPFIKFFNIEEKYAHNIDWDSIKVEEKIDGQLIALSIVDGKPYWFSNKSFVLKADFSENEHYDSYTKILYEALRKDDDGSNEPYKDNDYSQAPFFYTSNWVKRIPEGWTLLFELVSPYTIIKIIYPEIKLYFIGARNADGKELFYEDVKKEFAIPYETPKLFDLHNIKEVREVLDTYKKDKEGFVVVDKDYNRVKVKTKFYVDEPYIQSYLEKEAILKFIIEKRYDDILARYPNLRSEYEKEIKNYVTFINAFNSVYEKTINKYHELNDNRKEYSEFVRSFNAPFVESYLFKALSYSKEDLLDYINNLFLIRGYEFYSNVSNALKELEGKI